MVANTPDTPTTVEGRMEGLLSKDSSYRQRAETGARQEAERRGLLNTSLAATAGQTAAIESALPIAQQDAAQAYGAERQEAGFGQETATQAAGFGQETEQARLEREQETAMQVGETAQKTGLLTQQLASEERVAEVGAGTGVEEAQIAGEARLKAAQVAAFGSAGSSYVSQAGDRNWGQYNLGYMASAYGAVGGAVNSVTLSW